MANQPENSIIINPLKYLNNLPEFNGDRQDLQTFFTLIDRVHTHLQTYDELSQLVFSDIIKSKLKGKARQAIEINCHAMTWSEIKSVLLNNFGDRSSIDEIYDELRAVTFKSNTVEFYNEIKEKLHRLNNKTMNILGEGQATNQSAQNNKRTALNIFKSKMPEPMRTILFCRDPDSLESAMDILFQAGYAYTGNDTQVRNSKQYNNLHYRQYSHNKPQQQSTRYTQQQHAKHPRHQTRHSYQNYPQQVSGPGHFSQNTRFPIPQQLERPGHFPQNSRFPVPQQLPHPRHSSQNNRFQTRQQEMAPPEPMELNKHELAGENFPLSASDNFHI